MIFKKVLGIIRYLGAFTLLLLAYVGGILLYPLVYWFKNSILSKKYPLWWWFDDEDGLYGAEYWREANGITKKNFWVSYRWSGLRNPMWNAHTKIRPNSGKEILVKGYGKLTRDGEEISIMNSAVINYEDDQGNYEGNTGTNFSEKFSILGWAFIWFYKEKEVHWRISLAKKLIGKTWLQFQFGTFYRYIFKVKLTRKNI